MMQIEEQSDAAGSMPLLLAAELQDHLMSVTNDLERLQRLLDDAGEALSNHFYSASSLVMTMLSKSEGDPNLAPLKDVMQHIAGAITALQFQDMSTQLIAHTGQRLRSCADQLARDTFGMDDADGIAVVETAPLRPNPVTQDEMDAGSIELF
ncbi:MAG: hypothetical protein U1F32_17200 [Roseateles sp.]